MSLVDVCRLCLTKDNLVWIFDKRLVSIENIKDVIYVTTGVEIGAKDIISQKICQKCCQVTIKMFEFRKTSLKNDQLLRDECMQFLKENDIKIPNTDVTIKRETKSAIKEVKRESEPVYTVHPSVRHLSKVYPDIKLPAVCLKFHITPYVSMPLDDVETYFKVRNLDFNEHTKLALKSAKIATKKTDPSAKLKPGDCVTPSNPNRTQAKSESNIKNECQKTKTKINYCAPGTKIKEKVSNIKKPDATNTRSPLDTSNSDNNNDVKQEPKRKPSRDFSPDHTPPIKKRKILESQETGTKEKKAIIIETLGLVPKPNASSTTNTESSGLSYVANMSVPLHICNICNSVQYSAKDLRRHQLKHLRCQFCKLKCRSLENKNQHIENNCLIKKIMNNIPDVQLDKIECNVAVRRKYPEAFIGFPPLPNECNDIEYVPDSPREKTESKVDNSLSNARDPLLITNKDVAKSLISEGPNVTENRIEIIEITSDDEDASLATNKSNESLLKQSLLVTEDGGVNSAVSSPHFDKVPPHVPIQENIVYNTVSIVKPDIKIKGSCILDNIDPKTSDIKVLKELLANYRPIRLPTDKRIQTELPSNNSITINSYDVTCELANLKQTLHSYKIPVVIKNGSFHVSFNYEKPVKQTKTPCYLQKWNGLTPIDIKPTKVNAVTSSDERTVTSANNVQQTKYRILPSTATYNSTGICSSGPEALTATTSFTYIQTPNSQSSVSGGIVTSNKSVLKTNAIQPQNSVTSTAPLLVSAHVPTSSHLETPVPTTTPVGIIRVKNVWELT